MHHRHLIAAALVWSFSAFAHEGASPHPATPQRTSALGHLVEDSVIVEGTVAELQERLVRIERWPELFSDARSLERRQRDVWSVDFKQFGHSHTFALRREPRAVIFELAEAAHGQARLEYRLQPVDARRSRLTVRLEMPTPPQLTQEQALTLMRNKVEADLRDFARLSSRGETR